MAVTPTLPGIKLTGGTATVPISATAAPKPKHKFACTHCGHWKPGYYGTDHDIVNMAGGEDSVQLYCTGCHNYYNVSVIDQDLLKKPETQKAKGIWAIRKIKNIYMQILVPSVYGLLNVKEEFPSETTDKLKGLLAKYKKFFARPCPPSPEHGFVESRVVESIEEIEQVRKETLAANDASEILLMNPIDASFNIVWTPSLMAIGPGHDGATSGKGAISIPLVGNGKIAPEVIAEAGIAAGKGPYIEAVKQKGTPNLYLTQLRGGPLLESTSPDYIPEPVVVQQVIKTNGEDLLEWAKVVKNLAGKQGVVVWHPTGALTDHYSVHCRENKVPIVLTYEPQVGMTLESKPLAAIDPQAVLRGLALGDRLQFSDANDAIRGRSFVNLLLVALHNSAVMRGQASLWLGVAVAAILKLGGAALEGEARHAHGLHHGMKMKPDIYDWYTAKSLSFLRARLSRVTQILHYGFGDPDQTKTYGGRKWALCGVALAPLYNAVRDLAQDPTEKNASELVLALNVAVNQAHNGGWWLNKFVSNEAYDKIPLGDLHFVLDSSTAFWFTHQANLEFTDEQVQKFASRAAKWPVTEIEPLKWRKVTLDIAPGAFVLKLKASTVPNPKTITIPTTPAMVKSMLAAAGEIKIGRGRIDLVKPGGEIDTLWEETSLVAASRDPKVR